MSPAALALAEEFPVDGANDSRLHQQADIVQLHPAVPAQPTEKEIEWLGEANEAANRLGYIGVEKAGVRAQFIAQTMLLKALQPGEEPKILDREQQHAPVNYYSDTHQEQAAAQERGGIDSIFCSSFYHLRK